MHVKTTDPTDLLFIEPTAMPSVPFVDRYTQKITAAWRARRTSTYAMRGIHQCIGFAGLGCRAQSDNRDHWVHGLKTNSLCIHYVACHRAEVPAEALAIIDSWADMALPTDAELTGGRDDDSAETRAAEAAAVARQEAAERLVPSYREIVFSQATIAGAKWHRASFGEHTSGWCNEPHAAQTRLESWCRGDVVPEAPDGQCSVGEMSRLTEIAERDGNGPLADAIAAALPGGVGSEPWMAVSQFIYADPALLDELVNPTTPIPSPMIRREGAL